MAADRALIDALRAALSAEACPENAEPMQRYVRSELPCWGVKTPLRRKRVKEVVDAHPLEGFAAWRDTIRTLWDEATHREERYAAIQLARARPYRRHIGPGALPLFEHLVVTGAWWDLVDEIAWFTGGAAIGSEGMPALGPLGLSRLAEARRYRCVQSARLGPDAYSLWRRADPTPAA